MNRSNFLKSLATLIAAPSLIGQIEEPIKGAEAHFVWMNKTAWDFEKKWRTDREKAMWSNKGVWQQLEESHKYSYSEKRHLGLTEQLKDGNL